MTTDTETLLALARGLSDAQRAYLLALEPNRVDPDRPEWLRDVARKFQGRSHRKPLKGKGLASAHVLVRKGVIASRPEPVECGFHYASLTPLGLELQSHLRALAGRVE